MRFRIPLQLKETVTVVRQDAYDRNHLITVAEDVICLIAPERDLIRVSGGVAVGGTGWEALLEKPNDDIANGDILRRADDSELTVHRVRPLGDTMLLELRGDPIP